VQILQLLLSRDPLVLGFILLGPRFGKALRKNSSGFSGYDTAFQLENMDMGKFEEHQQLANWNWG